MIDQGEPSLKNLLINFLKGVNQTQYPPMELTCISLDPFQVMDSYLDYIDIDLPELSSEVADWMEERGLTSPGQVKLVFYDWNFEFKKIPNMNQYYFNVQVKSHQICEAETEFSLESGIPLNRLPEDNSIVYFAEMRKREIMAQELKRNPSSSKNIKSGNNHNPFIDQNQPRGFQKSSKRPQKIRRRREERRRKSSRHISQEPIEVDLDASNDPYASRRGSKISRRSQSVQGSSGANRRSKSQYKNRESSSRKRSRSRSQSKQRKKRIFGPDPFRSRDLNSGVETDRSRPGKGYKGHGDAQELSNSSGLGLKSRRKRTGRLESSRQQVIDEDNFGRSMDEETPEELSDDAQNPKKFQKVGKMKKPKNTEKKLKPQLSASRPLLAKLKNSRKSIPPPQTQKINLGSLLDTTYTPPLSAAQSKLITPNESSRVKKSQTQAPIFEIIPERDILEVGADPEFQYIHKKKVSFFGLTEARDTPNDYEDDRLKDLSTIEVGFVAENGESKKGYKGRLRARRGKMGTDLLGFEDIQRALGSQEGGVGWNRLEFRTEHLEYLEQNPELMEDQFQKIVKFVVANE